MNHILANTGSRMRTAITFSLHMSLSKGVFERRTSTGSEDLFPLMGSI